MKKVSFEECLSTVFQVCLISAEDEKIKIQANGKYCEIPVIHHTKAPRLSQLTYDIAEGELYKVESDIYDLTTDTISLTGDTESLYLDLLRKMIRQLSPIFYRVMLEEKEPILLVSSGSKKYKSMTVMAGILNDIQILLLDIKSIS